MTPAQIKQLNEINEAVNSAITKAEDSKNGLNSTINQMMNIASDHLILAIIAEIHLEIQKFDALLRKLKQLQPRLIITEQDDEGLNDADFNELIIEVNTLLGNSRNPGAASVPTHAPSDSIELHKKVANLNEHPKNCAAYGAYEGLVPKLGDGHACIPKILYFALKTGRARLTPGRGETAEGVYKKIVELCNDFSPGMVQSQFWKKGKPYYQQRMKELEETFKKIEFHKDAELLLLGDILMDRNGNDLVTARFFKRIHECGACPIILLSNHDASFLFWRYSHDIVMRSCGQSFAAAKFLIDNNLESGWANTFKLLDDNYFNHLAVFYYELDSKGNLNNISTHAPTGEKEIYQMAKGLAKYAMMRKNKNLFTSDQIEHLKKVNAFHFDENTGLEQGQLREIMDLMNEILHANALKRDKSCLSELIYLGYDEAKSEQSNDQGINPLITPFYYVIWNRESPSAPPPQGKGYLYLNGHSMTDKHNHFGKIWTHNNQSLDDESGKSEDLMNGQPMCYALPVSGFTPMPPIAKTAAAPARMPHSRARDTDEETDRARDRDPAPGAGRKPRAK